MAGIKLPNISQLRDIASKGKLQLTDDQLKEYQDVIATFQPIYKRLAELTVEKEKVKYPRTPGYRPKPEENKYNAWWYKTDIKGKGEGKLLGKRIAIKDNTFVAGVPMLNGSHLMEGFIPDEDATVVTRILDEGGHIVGKANCENLCSSGSSITCASGPVLNPVNTDHIAGGSSSGCAVLVKVGEVDMAVGGDQGGSIRIPSSWCGIVGLKPTYGLVPYTGAMSLEASMDHLGPMANNVKDCALFLEVLAGYDDGRDFRQPRDLTVPEYTKQLNGNVTGKKIGILKEGFSHCEEDVIALVRAACTKLEGCGASVEEVSIPEHVDVHTVWFPACVEGSYGTMLKDNVTLTSVKGPQNFGCINHLRSAMKTKAQDMPESLKLWYLFGTYMLENYGYHFFAKSRNLLPQIVKAYNNALAIYDVLVMPTLPKKAPKMLKEGYKIAEYNEHLYGMLQNTAPFDSTGHPALSLNVGESEGLPVGMQIVGKHWDEVTIFNVAYAVEKALAQN